MAGRGRSDRIIRLDKAKTREGETSKRVRVLMKKGWVSTERGRGEKRDTCYDNELYIIV